MLGWKSDLHFTQDHSKTNSGIYSGTSWGVLHHLLLSSEQATNSQFPERWNWKSQRQYKDSQKDGKMALLTLNEIIYLLSNLSEDTNIPLRKLEKPGKSRLPARRKRYSLSFCNCFQTGKFPHLLTSKKYHIISVYCHLLLSMIQSPSSPFSPSSLILPTRLSQSFEPYRTYYTSTIPHHQFF